MFIVGSITLLRSTEFRFRLRLYGAETDIKYSFSVVSASHLQLVHTYLNIEYYATYRYCGSCLAASVQKAMATATAVDAAATLWIKQDCAQFD